MRLSTERAERFAALPAEGMLIASDLSCILDHALAERAAGRGRLTDLLGLDGDSLRALRDRWFPEACLPDLDAPLAKVPADQRAIAELILWRGGRANAESRWLARVLARRAMEPHHLWEDLGLVSRAALGDLIARHFPGLKAANSQNMRWKKFLYRQICSDQGFALCLSPTCGECPERAECFAPE